MSAAVKGAATDMRSTLETSAGRQLQHRHASTLSSASVRSARACEFQQPAKALPAPSDFNGQARRLRPRGRPRRHGDARLVLARLRGLCAIGLLMIAAPARADCPEIRVATVPLLPGLRPVVMASIDGHSVEMLVDTGDQETAVTPQTAAELHLPRDPGRRMRVHTLGGIVGSANVIVRSLKVGTINFPDLSATVVPAPSMTNGTAPGGTIGADVLSQYDLNLDISRRTLTFYQTDACTPFSPPWHGPYQIVPAQVGDRRFIIPATLNGHTIQAQFDTG